MREPGWRGWDLVWWQVESLLYVLKWCESLRLGGSECEKCCWCPLMSSSACRGERQPSCCLVGRQGVEGVGGRVVVERVERVVGGEGASS